MRIKDVPRRRLRALRVRLRRIFPPFHFGAFPLRRKLRLPFALPYLLLHPINLRLAIFYAFALKVTHCVSRTGASVAKWHGWEMGTLGFQGWHGMCLFSCGVSEWKHQEE